LIVNLQLFLQQPTAIQSHTHNTTQDTGHIGTVQFTVQDDLLLCTGIHYIQYPCTVYIIYYTGIILYSVYYTLYTTLCKHTLYSTFRPKGLTGTVFWI